MLRGELYLSPLAKKLYYGWTNTMTSSNESSWKLPAPEMKSWLRLWYTVSYVPVLDRKSHSELCTYEESAASKSSPANLSLECKAMLNDID